MVDVTPSSSPRGGSRAYHEEAQEQLTQELARGGSGAAPEEAQGQLTQRRPRSCPRGGSGTAHLRVNTNRVGPGLQSRRRKCSLKRLARPPSREAHGGNKRQRPYDLAVSAWHGTCRGHQASNKERGRDERRDLVNHPERHRRSRRLIVPMSTGARDLKRAGSAVSRKAG